MAKRTYGKYQGKSPNEKLTDARQALFDALLADMEREGSRWVKEWSFPHPPMNGVTGEGYGPRNTAMLMYAMRDGGFRDPRFATLVTLAPADMERVASGLAEAEQCIERYELADGITFNAELEMEKIDCERGEQGLDDICDAKSEEADLVADSAMGEREAPDNEQDK